MQVLFQLSYSPTEGGVYQRRSRSVRNAGQAPAVRTCHHRRMTTFDLLLRGGTVIDGTGSPGAAPTSASSATGSSPSATWRRWTTSEVATVLDVAGRVVAPGFVDPHGHSDGSLFVDGALASHLHQGFTTQLSGNCGDSLAPVTGLGREIVELSLRPNGLVARWETFAEYLDAVEEQPLGPNVAFLVGHGTVRAAVLGRRGATADADELAAMVGAVEAAMDAGAIGLSSGLIYAPGLHAAAGRGRDAGRAVARARRAVRDPHAQRVRMSLLASLDESVAAVRGRRRRAPAAGLASQVRLAGGLGPGRRGGRPARGGPCGGARRRGRPVPVHRRRDDPRDDPAARAPGSRRRCLRRRPGRPATSAT